jgi:cell division septation protein DedD
MSSLLNLQQSLEPPTSEPADEPVEESAEFEIVLGRRQIASTSLVAIVLIAVFSGVSYLVGKSMAPKAEAAKIPSVVEQTPVAPPGPDPAMVPQQPASEQPKAAVTPVVGEAVPGQVYLQVGVIEKGPAIIWAEGLRTHGLDAFVSPGPTDGLGLWRVLIGPLPDPPSYQRAKDTLTSLSLTNFGRRYSQ